MLFSQNAQVEHEEECERFFPSPQRRQRSAGEAFVCQYNVESMYVLRKTEVQQPVNH